MHTNLNVDRLMQLLGLPSEVIVYAVLPFLQWKAIVTLDSSILDQELRRAWLLCLSKCRCEIKLDVRSYRMAAQLWACKKQIWFSTLEIDDDWNADALTRALESEFDWKKIASLHICNANIKLDVCIMNRLMVQLTEVQELTLKEDHVSVASTLLSVAKKLKSVRVKGYSGEELFSLLMQYRSQLERLRMEHACEPLLPFLAVANNLLEFDLTAVESNDVLIALAKHCPRLQILKFEWGMYTSDEGFIALANACHNLRFVQFGRYLPYTDTSFVALAVNCKFLTHLETFAYNCTNDAVLRAIGQHCSMFESLHVNYAEGISDGGLTALARGCPQLRTLLIPNCGEIGDAGIIAIAVHCPLLSILIVGPCHLLTDAAVHAVLRNCTSLSEVRMVGTKLLTPACFDPLDGRGVGTTPTYIMVSGSARVTHFSAKQIAVVHSKYPFVHITMYN